MGQLIEDLESCVRTAKLAGPPWGMYTRMEITAEHAKQILGLLKASRTIWEEEQETAPDRPRNVVLGEAIARMDEI